MNCPKGHAGAECIIGNFWKCPVCDRAPVPTATRQNTIFDHVTSVVQGIWPQWKVEDYVQGHQNANLPRVVGQIPINEVSQAQLAWWRLELEHIYLTKYAHDGRQFTDYIDGCVKVLLNTISLDLMNKMLPRPKAIEVFGPFPQWVTDDGRIVIQFCSPLDVLELRMRAIWRPAP